VPAPTSGSVRDVTDRNPRAVRTSLAPSDVEVDGGEPADLLEPPMARSDAASGSGVAGAVAVAWSRALDRLSGVHPAAWLTGLGAVVFTIVFGRLGVQHHRNFGTWAFDMGIYDQGFWLVSRGGQSFVTVRGMEFWGHHVNLIVLAFVPFYWLGAGPAFLYVAQAAVLGAGAIPTYLIARDRFARPWLGLLFAVVYLMYAPVQWISSANFHPEALVITPFLFAWWFAQRTRWTACFVALVVAMSTREDAALAVVVFGVVLWWSWLGGRGSARDRRMALTAAGLGALWYLVATRLVIPHFNDGKQPFYIGYFYGNYGDSRPAIAARMLERPDLVVRDATQPDRLRFYRDLMLPWGGVPLAAPVHLLMAAPQLVASVIGLSPYARTIRYQYTSVMIAPIVIAAIEGAAWLWRRFRAVRTALVPYLLVCAYVTNVAWSPSPISPNDTFWATPNPRHEVMREALALVPDDASVTATYNLGPHLSHREEIYDWPNPWVPAYWGNDDGARLPDPATVDVIVVDMTQVGAAQQELIDRLIGPDRRGGEFDVLLDSQDIVVARRPGT
jgi:uncharacterized membrane protein